MHYIKDGVAHALTGARGTFTLSLTPGEIPRFQFTFTGLRSAPITATQPTADTRAFQPPVAVNAAHTTEFSLHGHRAPLSAFTLDVANEVVYRNLVGGEDVIITDRAPTGSVTIDEPLLTEHDFHAAIAAHETGPLTITHGLTAGHQIVMAAPRRAAHPADGDRCGGSDRLANEFGPRAGHRQRRAAHYGEVNEPVATPFCHWRRPDARGTRCLPGRAGARAKLRLGRPQSRRLSL